MKKMTKKNNKGFSLVELIVVVLIMGIIAVALAPQVMKWVGTSRENSDKNTAKDIKSAIQIAVADFQGDGGKLDSTAVTFKVELGANGTNKLTASGAKDKAGTEKKLQNYVEEVMGGDYPKTSDNQSFQAQIDSNGKVTVWGGNVASN